MLIEAQNVFRILFESSLDQIAYEIFFSIFNKTEIRMDKISFYFNRILFYFIFFFCSKFVWKETSGEDLREELIGDEYLKSRCVDN